MKLKWEASQIALKKVVILLNLRWYAPGAGSILESMKENIVWMDSKLYKYCYLQSPTLYVLACCILKHGLYGERPINKYSTNLIDFCLFQGMFNPEDLVR